MMFQDRKMNVESEYINYKESVQPKQIFDEDFKVLEELEVLDIKPRIHDEVYVPPEIKTEKAIWKLPISIFREYRFDTQVIYKIYFNLDIIIFLKILKIIRFRL